MLGWLVEVEPELDDDHAGIGQHLLEGNDALQFEPELLR